MKQENRKLLKNCLRGIEIHDEDDGGVRDFVIRFKVRDDPKTTANIYNSMSHDDACNVAHKFIGDWNDPDSYFNLSFDLDADGFVTIKGSYRT